MDHLRNAPSKLAVTLGVTIGFLSASLAPARPQARDLLVVPQKDAVEVKFEVTKKVAPADRLAEKVQVLVPPPPPAGPDGGNKDEMLRDSVLQLVPVLRSELRMLTSVVGPTPEQRRAIALESVRAIKQVAKTQVDANAGINRVVVANGVRQVRRVVNTKTEPRKLVHELVEIAARVKLSPEQFARFLEESQRKTQDRKEAVLLCVVVKLDGLLILSHEQREKIQEILRKQWDERSYPALETLDAYENYFPVLPDAQINPILSDEQRGVWRNAQKINFTTIRNANQAANGVIEVVRADEPDPDLKAALAEEMKP